MIVTVNTDAAFHPQFKVAGYAFWIVCNQGRKKGYGHLRGTMNRPDIAEFQCVINAMHILGKMKLTGITKIIVNTDCLNVIHIIKKDKVAIKKYHLGKWGLPMREKFISTLREFGLNKAKIEFRHVRSHSETNSKKGWVNDWCDRMAKLEMWRKINSLKLNTQ